MIASLSPLNYTISVTLLSILGLMAMLWMGSLIRRDAGIVDPFWGTGFAVVVWIAWLLNRPVTDRGTLLAVLTTIWGLRLSIFLLIRNLGHAEDYRYRAMRDHHGPRFWWVSLVTVFLLQAVILWFVSLPVQVALVDHSAAAIGVADFLGILLWAVGLFFESVGDWQLYKFKQNPENNGRVMDRGLWRYTRHPNYFGDFCVWWGLFLIAAGGGARWTVFSPLLMSFLLLKVSGVRLLERTITDRRPDYAAYKERTNAFFPGPPKSR
jgi:steroid 5-alpha reductase family enzyme